jgi:hypothetical protein
VGFCIQETAQKVKSKALKSRQTERYKGEARAMTMAIMKPTKHMRIKEMI